MQQSPTVQNYRIAISNKLYHPADFKVNIKGLPANGYHLSADSLKLLPAARGSLTLSVAKSLPRGLYSITVDVSAENGWLGNFRIQHYSEQE